MYTIVFNSLTGNTKLLADTIREVLPSDDNGDIGTCGFGGSEAYFERILTNVKGNIDSSNEIIGEYMCQGKMPSSVRERYLKMKESDNCPPNIDALIDNFDKALSHPDEKDLEKLSQKVLQTLTNVIK